ncbi:MAG: UDP-N-acetylmuramoyl-L-alanine--D-glutamate ligase [Cellvibrionaceae bacterium]
MTLIATSQLTVIVGLGVTGLSAARYLKRRGVRFVAVDSRDNPPGLLEFQQLFPEVGISLGKLDQGLLLQASEIIVSPGMSLKIPEIAAAIEAGVSVVGDIELFAREVKVPVIAITGSNAKTTVTTLVGQMALDAGIKTAVAGNIGRPVLDLLEEEFDLFVLELSSFQLETTHTLKATAATVLNISLDHMDRYSNLAEYHRAKQKIYFGAQQVIVNRADPLTQPPLADGIQRLSFGLDRPDRDGFGLIVKEGKEYIAYEFKALLAVNKLQLRGRHNVANCLAALGLGQAINLPMDSMLKTLCDFSGLPHRCQLITTLDQVEYINDSKATNVGATLAALEGFAQDKPSIVLIAGGDGKDADFSELKTAIQKTVRLLILIGRDAQKIADIVQHDVQIIFADSLYSAVDVAKNNAKQGDTVLLSPACASFDMFSGYEERGREFISAVIGEAA